MTCRVLSSTAGALQRHFTTVSNHFIVSPDTVKIIDILKINFNPNYKVVHAIYFLYVG